MGMDVHALIPELERAFRATRDAARAAFAKPPKEERMKRDGTLVTALDHELEERLANTLLDLDPDWGVWGEEDGEIRAGTRSWHLDAVDGTLNFAKRIPLFVSQAALLDGTDPLVAVIYDPLQDKFAWAAKGEGAWQEGQRLQVANRDIQDALLLVDLAKSGLLMSRPEFLPKLRRSVFRMRALGCAGMQFLSVAEGTADAFLSTRRKPSPLHDLAPGTLLVREAGGLVTNLEGEDALQDRRCVLAAHESLHEALRDQLD